MRFFEEEEFESYPWGREAFSCLVQSMRECSFVEETYTIHGCVLTLLIWVYESVPGIGNYKDTRGMVSMAQVFCSGKEVLIVLPRRVPEEEESCT
ncbi:unnamed protein product [Cochlearia groenlandica]